MATAIGACLVRNDRLFFIRRFAADVLGIGSCYIGRGWTAFADSCGQEFFSSGTFKLTVTSLHSFF